MAFLRSSVIFQRKNSSTYVAEISVGDEHSVWISTEGIAIAAWAVLDAVEDC